MNEKQLDELKEMVKILAIVHCEYINELIKQGLDDDTAIKLCIAFMNIHMSESKKEPFIKFVC